MITGFNHSPDLGWLLFGAAAGGSVLVVSGGFLVWVLSRALWRAWKRRKT